MNIINEEQLRSLDERIADARMLLSVTEQELIALQKGVVAEKYTIGELLKEKNELLTITQELQILKMSLNTEVNDLKSQLQIKKIEFDQIASDEYLLKASISQAQEENKNIERELQEKQAKLTQREAEIIKKEEQIEKDLQNLNEKKKKLQTVISEI